MRKHRSKKLYPRSFLNARTWSLALVPNPVSLKWTWSSSSQQPSNVFIPFFLQQCSAFLSGNFVVCLNAVHTPLSCFSSSGYQILPGLHLPMMCLLDTVIPTFFSPSLGPCYCLYKIIYCPNSFSNSSLSLFEIILLEPDLFLENKWYYTIFLIKTFVIYSQLFNCMLYSSHCVLIAYWIKSKLSLYHLTPDSYLSSGFHLYSLLLDFAPLVLPSFHF